jgi:nitrate reductase NapE component
MQEIVAYMQGEKTMPGQQITPRIASSAVVATLIIGIFFTWFGLMECAIEFVSRQLRLGEAIKDVTESVAFGLSFILLAWILWSKPILGGILLVMAGFSFAVWMYNDWTSPVSIADWCIRAIITVIPVGMGIFTVTHEHSK